MMDAACSRGAMESRKNGALIERMESAGIELRINANCGSRECSGRVVTIAPDRAEDDPASRDIALIAAPRSGHVDRVAVHARIRQGRRYAANTNASTATTTSRSKIHPTSPPPPRCCSV